MVHRCMSYARSHNANQWCPLVWMESAYGGIWMMCRILVSLFTPRLILSWSFCNLLPDIICIHYQIIIKWRYFIEICIHNHADLKAFAYGCLLYLFLCISLCVCVCLCICMTRGALVFILVQQEFWLFLCFCTFVQTWLLYSVELFWLAHCMHEYLWKDD